MSKSHHLEDIFLEFFDLFDQGVIDVRQQQISAINSFERTLNSGQQLTENQASYIIKILHQYKNQSKDAGLDYSLQLSSPQWARPFRVLDTTKSLTIEKQETGELFILMKCPFKIKEQFEKNIFPIVEDYSSSIWDAEKQVRRLKLYNFNLIELHEFAINHQFDIDENFMDCLANFEEIWQSSEDILPQSLIVDGKVNLINATESAERYFGEKSTGELYSDLFLARSMGYFLKKKPENLIEKILVSESTSFWIKNLESFFDIYKNIKGPIAVILGKSDKTDYWVRNFVKTAISSGVEGSDIRVCFRYDKSDNNGFNAWVKENGFGGKVEGGKLFIFQNKPPKWLFTDEVDVKIIVTNSLYPIPSSVTQIWMESHPCILFVGDIKATNIKDKKIVEL